VEAAREIQRKRFLVGENHTSEEDPSKKYDEPNISPISCNADMRLAEVRKFAELDEVCRTLIRAAMSQLQLSARAYHRILKLALCQH
jgi:magnesium chelatase family protein